MIRRINATLTVFYLVLDLALTGVALYLAQIARYRLPFGAELTVSQVYLHPYIYLMVAAIWIVVLFANVYGPGRIARFSEELYALTVSVVVATLILAGALYLSFRDVPRRLFFYFALIDLYLLIGLHSWVRLILRLLGRASQQRTRLLIMGAGKVGRALAQTVGRDGRADLELVGFLDDDPRKIGQHLASVPVLGPLDKAMEVIEQRGISEVIFALPLRAQERLTELALELQRLPVRTWVVPDYFDLSFMRTRMAELGGLPLIGLREPAIDGLNRLLKRVFDLVLGTIALVLAAPLMLIVAVLVRLDSPGPALLRQQRVGENCELFWVYKFRSMVADAEERKSEILTKTDDGKPIHKMANDPRITRLGQILRQTSIDELPQLINVIKGEMSLVGPRPELPWLVDEYEPWQRKRFAVPPGITGWWQVSGRSDRLMHLHTEDDLYYIQNYSILLDLKILWKTIGVVLRGTGAY